jgi:very-short-patch-repair endonuclease
MTDAESLLWRLLRGRRMGGAKFRRQHPLGRYILDFYCIEKKLCLELDGGQHADALEYDRSRDAWIRDQGIRVLRFWNNQMLAETEAVLEVIYGAIVEDQSATPPRSTDEHSN